MKLQKNAFKTTLCILLGLIMFLSGCSGKDEHIEDFLANSWYVAGSSSPAFTLYSDGTCEIDGEYGTGTWSVVNNNQLKLTNFYGETETATIISTENDCLTIDIGSENYVTLYNSPTVVDEANQETEFENGKEELQPSPEVVSMQDYHDGLAWIVYTDLGNQYWACINKDGHIVFQYDANDITNVTAFSNGYAYLERENALYTIDKTGKIIAQYDKNGVNIRCYEDGYVLIENENSGFGSKSFEYTIYDKNGSIIEQFSHEKAIDPIAYCGKGVFAFQLTPNYGDPTDYYFTEIQTWVNAPSSLTPYFYGDTAIIGTTYRDEGDTRKGGIIAMSSSGECFEYICDNLSDWAVYPSAINENVCTIYDDDRIVTIVLSGDSIESANSYILEEEYSKRIVGEPTPDSYMIHDGRIVLHLRGEDGKIYAGVFDKELKLMFQPILGSFSTYADGLLTVESDGLISMYDVDGNIIYSLTEKGYSSSSVYSDGAILVRNQNEEKLYRDTKGNLLFDHINFENIKTLYVQDS